ncbi:hypothetical protein CPC08DRAFT_714668 [Agrocybe pediades]|nr:hypothetical protein CPC08DRAFT_714668 [Agrocybe pediades]
MSKTTTLNDLPTELIFQILQDETISQTDMYAVGLLSRRLNTIAMPVFLEAKGVSNLEDAVNLCFDEHSIPTSINFQSGPFSSRKSLPDPDFGPEAGIMAAFWITTIRELRCTFPQSFTDQRTLIYHLGRLQLFLGRLQRIEKVVFYFSGQDKNHHYSSNPWAAVSVPFADEFGAIIEVLATRGCEELILHNKSHFLEARYWDLGVDDEELLTPARSSSTADDPQKGPPRKGFFRKTKIKMRHVLTQLSGNQILEPLPERSPLLLYPQYERFAGENSNLGRLRHVYIQTPFALLPRCLPSIRNMIHSSIATLRSLTLSYITFDQHLFDSCLSALALDVSNRITSLTITNCRGLSAKGFLQFIACFQRNLESLEVDRQLSYFDSSLPPQLPQFNEMRSVKAPLDWVIAFLEPQAEKSHHPLPKLCSLTIQCRTTTTTYFTYEHFGPLISAVLQPLHVRQQSSPSRPLDVTLDLKLNPNHPWQMEEDRVVLNAELGMHTPGHITYSAKLEQAASHHSLSSEVHANTALACALPQSNPPSRSPSCWDLITKLELSPTYPPVNSTKASLLARWVNTFFPCAKEVTLPIPYIPRLMPMKEYKQRQWELGRDASVFLGEELSILEQERHQESPKLAWKKFTVGPWSFELHEAQPKTFDPQVIARR